MKSTDMTDNNESNQQLGEEDIRRIAREETAVETSDGTTVSVADLVAQGFSREQALGIVGLVGLGSTLVGAVALATSNNARAQVAATGSGTFEIDTVIANTLETATVETDELDGGIVGSAGAVTNLPGNIYATDTEPSSPEDDDLLFLTGGGA